MPGKAKRSKLADSPELHERLAIPFELRCGACGRKGTYPVGRLYVDPTLTQPGQERLDDAFSFTGYFHCTHCKAGGPWQLTPTSTRALMVLVVEAMSSPEHARIHLARLTLFDGTVSRWPTAGEVHLKQVIDKDPGDYFPWNRLGNLYKCGDAGDKAVEAFHEALKRNEHDVESLHSLGEIYGDRKEDETAAGYFHQVLLHARHAPARTSRELLRVIVRDTLEWLTMLHLESDMRIPLFPKPPGPDPSTVLQFNLTDEEDMERMVDLWLTGKSPAPAKPAKPVNPASNWSPGWTPRPPQTVGRNDPCPCGSGKKYKACCLRS
jgi:hypothetical protein